jgi:hypothetical protein
VGAGSHDKAQTAINRNAPHGGPEAQTSMSRTRAVAYIRIATDKQADRA